MNSHKSHVQYVRVACGHCAKLSKASGVLDVGSGVSAFKPAMAACSKCKRTRYCDSGCQRADFQAHKLLCPALVSVNSLEASVVVDGGSTGGGERAKSVVLDSINSLVHITPGLDPGTAAKYVGRFCRACFRTVGMIPSGEAALHCSKCLLAWCCSEACWCRYAPLHASAGSCGALRCIVESDDFQRRCVIDDGEPEVACFTPEKRVARFSALPLPEPKLACTDAFRRDVGVPAGIQFGQGWGPYFASRGAPQPIGAFPPGLWLHSTNSLSRPLTILLGLQAAYGSAWLSKATRLTIHLVGAEPSFEFGQLMAYEELLHLLPALTQLSLAFVGPEMRMSGDPNVEDVAKPLNFKPIGCCPGCTACGAQRRFDVKIAPYDEFVEGCASNLPPDLVVAFQPGFSERRLANAWGSSIALVLKRGWPLLVTSFAEDEVAVDWVRMGEFARGAGLTMPKSESCAAPSSSTSSAAPSSAAGAGARSVRVLEHPRANPFASLVLQDNWGAMDEGGDVGRLVVDSFIARNAYFFVVAGPGPA